MALIWDPLTTILKGTFLWIYSKRQGRQNSKTIPKFFPTTQMSRFSFDNDRGHVFGVVIWLGDCYPKAMLPKQVSQPRLVGEKLLKLREADENGCLGRWCKTWNTWSTNQLRSSSREWGLVTVAIDFQEKIFNISIRSQYSEFILQTVWDPSVLFHLEGKRYVPPKINMSEVLRLFSRSMFAIALAWPGL